MQEIETVLTNTMQDIPNLSKVPILVLTFSTYNATPRKDLLLGEVGLSVFTVEGGVVENFAALIDPGDTSWYLLIDMNSLIKTYHLQAKDSQKVCQNL